MAKSDESIITLSDAYKYSHHRFYVPGMTRMYSYLESRGGKYDETVFFGLQYFLKQYCTGQVITEEKIQDAEELMLDVFGRDDIYKAGNFRYLVQKHGGKLPIEIKAVPEGMKIPVSNVLMTMENTDHTVEASWLTNFLEGLLVQVWYPTTVATISNQVLKGVKKFYDKTASAESYAGIQFVLNDFGFRGVSSVESAGLGGMAHIVNSMGSDNIIGSVFAKRHYGAKQAFGKSIPATEHSVMTLSGVVGEPRIMEHVLDEFNTGHVACVSDSYNIIHACKNIWGDKLKAKVLARKGTLVIRPDSGDPLTTLILVFDALFERFGYTLNDKGYKVLPPQVRVIQGDGVNYDSIIEMYETLTNDTHKISAENLVLGMGGALLQKLDRDTQKFAFKCSWAEINGVGTDVQKSPTEFNAKGEIIPSFKKSKAGRLKLVKDDNGKFHTVREDDEEWLAYEDILVPVFRDGELLVDYKFEDVRARAHEGILV